MEIYVSGLGGLGLISLTKRLCLLLSERYTHVLSSESRGIAQRRGSVSSSIRAGDSVFTAQLYRNHADVIIALEALEALRQPKLIKPGTICVISDLCINNLGGAQSKNGLRYPDLKEIIYTITKLGGKVLVIPYQKMMQEDAFLKVHISSVCLAAVGRLLGATEQELKTLFPELYKDPKSIAAMTQGFGLFPVSEQVEAERNVA